MTCTWIFRLGVHPNYTWRKLGDKSCDNLIKEGERDRDKDRERYDDDDGDDDDNDDDNDDDDDDGERRITITDMRVIWNMLRCNNG